MKTYFKHIVLFLVFLIVSTPVFSKNIIVVSKQHLELYVVNELKDTVFRAPCGLGKNLGDKRSFGDCKTPEGVFAISAILDSSQWKHDFNDGAGLRDGAYGPYFLRLSTPGFTGIGIHGTCFPESIGTRCSEGCVRLKNDDLSDLIRYVNIGTEVIIEKDI